MSPVELQVELKFREDRGPAVYNVRWGSDVAKVCRTQPDRAAEAIACATSRAKRRNVSLELCLN